MAISITDYSSYYTQNSSVSGVQSEALENKIGNLSVEDSSDDELMEACKEFESYLLEQVIKQVKESMLDSDEDENEYMNVFGDTMVENIASTISDTTDLGIAQSLYESMKNNLSNVNIVSADTADTETTAEYAGAATTEEQTDTSTIENVQETTDIRV
jgi:flagellar protein FlgJ